VSHVVMIGMSPRFDADALQQTGQFWETDASAERKSILARNMAQLTDAVLGEASPEEVVALEYVARAPMYWFDPEYDASWLWADVPFDTELMSPILEGLGEYDVRRGLSDLSRRADTRRNSSSPGFSIEPSWSGSPRTEKGAFRGPTMWHPWEAPTSRSR